MKLIDFRSDTVTKPTTRMREAIFNSVVGDDMYGEDPTINELEKLASQMSGKESALFVTSGTQGNLLAVLSQTTRGNEIILPEDSHMILSETGNLASIANVQTRTLGTRRGQFNKENLAKTIRIEKRSHKPETGLICVENTHTNSGGSILPVDYLRDIYKLAKAYDIPLHMDGSRLFNASIGLGTDAKEITQYADTVQFCLSKGLGAPMGSLLVGPKDVITRARRWRKSLGGASRQAGIVGAAGIVALKEMVDRLVDDHKMAKLLGETLEQNTNLEMMNKEIESNIVLLSIQNVNLKMEEVLNALKKQGVFVNALDSQTIRFVTHHEITREDILRAGKIIQSLPMRNINL